MSIGFTDRSGLQAESTVDRLKRIVLVLTRVKTRQPTPKAVLVRDGAGVEAWLPLRHIEKIEEGMNNQIRVTIPTWLATEKGLRSVPAPDSETLF